MKITSLKRIPRSLARRAAREAEELGALCVDTMMALRSAGVDPERLDPLALVWAARNQ